MKHLIYIVFISFFFLSCSDENSNQYNISNLNTKVNSKKVLAADLFDSIQFIPLETTPECLLRAPSVLTFNEDFIYLLDNDLYRFDTKGKFCNKIGRKGGGNGEHNGIYSASYDENLDIFFIGSGGNKFYKYKSDGQFLGSFTPELKKGIILSSRWSSSLKALVCESREYEEDGVTISLNTFSQEGDFIAQYPVYSDHEKVNTHLITHGKLRETKNGMFFSIPFCDDVFLLTEKGLEVAFKLNRGKHSPSRALTEDIEKEKTLDADFYTINNKVITPSFIYLYLSGDNGYRDVILDRRTHEIIHNQWYAFNDDFKHLFLLGTPESSFWPWVAVDNKLSNVIDPTFLEKEDLNSINTLSKTEYPVTENSNPVVVIVREKQ